MLSVCRFEYAFVPSTLSPYWSLPEKGPRAQTLKIRLLIKTRHLRNKAPRQYLKMVSTSHFCGISRTKEFCCRLSISTTETDQCFTSKQLDRSLSVFFRLLYWVAPLRRYKSRSSTPSSKLFSQKTQKVLTI